jgi:hypothetical protein
MKAAHNRNLLTRRTLLAAGVAMGSAPVLTAKAGSLDPVRDVRNRGVSTIGDVPNPMKVPKDRVHFTEMVSNPQKTCQTCKLFRGPSSCLFVAGEIQPDCTCMLWSAAKAA